MKNVFLLFSILLFITFIFYAVQSKTFAQTAPSLSVNASKNIAPFDKKMRGLAFGNWDFSWGRKFPGQIPGLINASKELQPGMVRWAGGLWANYVGFDRTKNQIRPQTEWFSSTGKGPYYYNYGIDEMASVDSFAKQIGAEVMIQVNVSVNEPEMWADMVKYAKEKGFNFKYWEMGNELDLEKWEGKSNIDPDEYSRRVVAYTKAMKAVDPTIKIVGGVPASGTDVFLTGWETLQLSQYFKVYQAMKNANLTLDAISYHWYQNPGNSISGMQTWTWDGMPETHGKVPYGRWWSEVGTKRITNEIVSGTTQTLVGISELGVDSNDIIINGNHAGAIWYADVLGRLAYTGTDFATTWASYGESKWALMYPDNLDNPTRVNIRPTYYAYLMYSKYFGDQMVEATSTNRQNLTIYASKDSRDGKVKLMIVNTTNAAITAPTSITGVTATSGKVYVMKSSNPTNMADNSVTQDAGTTINNVKIDGNNVTAGVASIQPQNVTLTNNTFSYTYPALSATAIVLDNNGSVTIPQPSPTPTTVQPTSGTGTRAQVTLLLHGIGKGGDNVNNTSTGNMSPIRLQRTVTVEIYNASNQLIGTKQGQVNYNNTNGNFTGVVTIGTVTTGSYTMKIKLPQFLTKTVPGIIQLTNDQLTNISTVSMVNGDANGDNRLSILDYNIILDCFSDLTPAKNCADASKKLISDLTDDGNVNQFDYNLFLRELSVQSGE